MKALVVRVGEAPEVVELPFGQDTAFQKVRELVGGYIVPTVVDRFAVWCDEDGGPKQLPINRLGIVGTFVVMALAKGAMRGLSRSALAAAHKHFGSIPAKLAEGASELLWIVGSESFKCRVLDTHCGQCGQRAVTEIPAPLLAQQTDGTTHVCNPGLGGCNIGYAVDPARAGSL